MTRRLHPPQRDSNELVRVGKKTFPVLDTLRVRGRTYLLLERISAFPRERYLALDPMIGNDGEFRTVYVLPRSGSTLQHLRALRRGATASDPFPLILDFDDRRDPIVVVLRWVPGVDLSRFLADVTAGFRPRPSPTEAFKKVHGLAHGLARWHRRCEFVHGDIKPANVLFERDSGRFVLIDFGSAWTCEKSVHRAKGDGIHPAYAAPELQTESTLVNFRSDQFSVAVILYELLTLEIPYDGLGGKAGRTEFVSEMQNCLIPPSRKNTDFKRLPRVVSDGIDRVTCRSLSLKPNDRFPTPGAFLDELDLIRALIQHPRLLAPAKSWLARLTSWIAG